MNDIQRKILLAFAFIPLSYFIGFLFENILAFLGNVDDYGHSNSKMFGWVYNLLHQRDGLYDMPNIFFYLLIVLINILIYRLI